jgi:hypothetical protein
MNDSSPASDLRTGSERASSGRRRFLTGGAALAPAVLTLSSQPALAGTCFSPSRSLSKNMSVSQAGKYGDCRGMSPGNYKTQTTPGTPSYNWPPTPAPATAFHQLFSGGLFKVQLETGGTRSLTLLEVLNLPTKPTGVASVPEDPSKLGFHVVGAYLNIQKGLVPPVVLTTTGLLTIWDEYVLRRYYEPTAGVKWDAATIVSYLKNSLIAP